jgi:hypothetical protein
VCELHALSLPLYTCCSNHNNSALSHGWHSPLVSIVVLVPTFVIWHLVVCVTDLLPSALRTIGFDTAPEADEVN